MKVKLKLFAIAKQFADNDVIELELASGATVADLQNALLQRLPKLEPMAQTLRFAVNSNYASDDTVLNESDELACIPPVSGG